MLIKLWLCIFSLSHILFAMDRPLDNAQPRMFQEALRSVDYDRLIQRIDHDALALAAEVRDALGAGYTSATHNVTVSGDIQEPCPIPSVKAIQALSLVIPENSKDLAKTNKTNTSGNHSVTPLGNLHFKAHDERVPLKPGIEVAMYQFAKLLFPMQQLLAQSCLTLFDNLPFIGKKRGIAQASQTIEGQSFSDFLSDVHVGSAHFELLDEANISAHIVFSILTNPSDYKPSNFIVKYRVGDKPLLVAIDNDMALANPIIQLKTNIPGKNGLHYVGVKNILYFIEPLMNRVVHSSIREHLLNLDEFAFVAAWLRSLKEKNKGYQRLVDQNLITADEAKILEIPICLVNGTVAKMVQALIVMKEVLRNNPHLTHKGLLMEMQPLVAHYCDLVGKQSPSAEEAYLKINSVVPKEYVQPAPPLEEVIPLGKQRNGEPLFKYLRHEKSLETDYEKRTQTIEKALTELEDYKRKEQNKRLQRTLLHEAVMNVVDAVYDEYAAIERLKNLVPLLSLDATDKDGYTAFDYAMKHRLELIAIYLITDCHAGVKINLDCALSFYNYVITHRRRNIELKRAIELLKERNGEFTFRLLLNLLLSENTKGLKKTILPHAEGYLKEAIARQLWAAQGNFRRTNVLFGRREVARVVLEDHGVLWFKRMPGIAGFESAISSLKYETIGHGALYSTLIRIEDEPFQVSLEVRGTNLQALMDDYPQTNPPQLNNLDIVSTSMMVIMAMLSNPEDDKPENYIVQEVTLPDGTRVFRLVCVDNENGLVPPIARGKNGPEHLVKSILLCLDLMNAAIPEKVKKHFIDIHPEELLRRWLQPLKSTHENHYKLFKKEEADALREKDCFIGVPFTAGMIHRLYDKLIRLRRILSEHEEASFTHLDLLHELEPALYRRHAPVLAKTLTVYDRFLEINGALYDKKDGRLVSSTSARALLKSQTVPVALNIKNADDICGPDAALKELEHSQKSVPKSNSNKMVDAFVALQSTAQQEQFMSTIDFKEVKEAGMNELFEKARNVEWSRLFLRNAIALKNTMLAGQLRLSNIRKLGLMGCKNITDDLIPLLAEQCPILEYLDLSEIPTMYSIASKTALVGPATITTGSFGFMFGFAAAVRSGVLTYRDLLSGDAIPMTIKDFLIEMPHHFMYHMPFYCSIPQNIYQNLFPGRKAVIEQMVADKVKNVESYVDAIRVVLGDMKRFQKSYSSLYDSLRTRSTYLVCALGIGFVYFATPFVASTLPGLLLDKAYRKRAGKKLLEFPALKTLKANNCPNLYEIALSCPELLNLEINGCTRLGSLLLDTNSLRVLEACKAINLNDTAVNTLLARCNKLTHLQVSGCTKVNEIRIREAAPQFPLSYLNACSASTKTTIESLLRNTYPRELLDVSHMNVNPQEIVPIIKACENTDTLTSINLGPTVLSNNDKDALYVMLQKNSYITSVTLNRQAIVRNQRWPEDWNNKIAQLLERNRKIAEDRAAAQVAAQRSVPAVAISIQHAPIARQPLLQGLLENNPIKFTVALDNEENYGNYVLRIDNRILDRKSAIEQLIAHKNDGEVRRLALPELLRAFYKHNWPYQMRERKYQALMIRYHEALASNDNATLAEIHRIVTEYCMNPDIFENFVRYDFRHGKGWVSYIDCSSSMLDALAYLNKFSFYIWEPDQPNATHISPIHLHKHTNPQSHFHFLLIEGLERLRLLKMITSEHPQEMCLPAQRLSVRYQPTKSKVFGLAIDGGGMSALIAASVLRELEKATNSKIYELFDAVCGSGSGGVIALGLTASENGYSPLLTNDQLVRLFSKNDGLSLFNRSSKRSKEPQFPAADYEKLMRSYFKDSVLSDALTQVIIPCIKNENDPHTFDRNEARKKISHDYYLSDIARAAWAEPRSLGAAFITNAEQNKEQTKQKYKADTCFPNPARKLYDHLSEMNPEAEIYILSLGAGSVKEESDTLAKSVHEYLAGKLKTKYIRPVVTLKTQDLYDTSSQVLDSYVEEGKRIGIYLLGNDAFRRLLQQNKTEKEK